ncbi:hypothetical protein AGLY_005189 [Aphis glycines]|uniref:Uncharacterized protein n=1 Tax=Aphis glycines TaxID=307491 RepID=A0A6G0TWX7_APHGL|nr:hypothetical protein AGLY_005189 [Aphis glycines]
MYSEIPKTDSKTERPPNPRCNANFFEIITHSWILNLLKIGRLRDLNETDLYTTLDDQKSSTLGDKLEKIWRSELANASSMNRNPNLLRALIRMFGAKFILYGLLLCIMEIIFNMSQPILIGELLAYFNHDNSKNIDIKYAYLYSSVLICSMLMTTILTFFTYEEMINEIMKVKAACCSLIFRKTLCLSHKTFGETAVGQVINLISNDVNRFDCAKNLHYLWIGPLQIIVGIYFLWQDTGVSLLVGVATFFFFIPLQGCMGKIISKYRLQTAKKTDERIRLMNEIISGIQVIKMYTWEKPFGNLIKYTRHMSQPILIGELLAYFNHDNSKNIDIKYAYLYSSVLICSMLMTTILTFFTYEEMINEIMKAKAACCSLIFRKTLCLSHKTFGETAVGQVINLISNDVNRFDCAKNLHYLWIGPLQIIVGIYFLWQDTGVSLLVGVATFFFFIPLQGCMGKIISKYRLQTAKKTDERIRLMNEIISGIQVIKMYTWEKPFGNLIKYTRQLEVKQIKGATFIKFIWVSLKVIQSRFQIFISILIYVLLGNRISFQKVYVLTCFFNLLHLSMAAIFSLSLLEIGELMVSIKRIQHYLLLEEKYHQIQNSYSKYDKSVEHNIGQSPIVDDQIANNCNDFENKNESVNSHGIVILNTSAKWTDVQNNNTLENINLTVNSGQLVAVIGPIGAGKSSLIQAILRELPAFKGKISVDGVLSYASQEPWIFAGTIQQNILFGSPMDKERFKEVIDVCALKSDLEHFPLADETMVGERGITLSGGQKARINLARAVYKKADIYLLDDPLSAVDVKVGNHLFEKCIKNYLKEKACILITHQVHYLSEVDHIVLMDNGKIIIEGSYQSIQASVFDFAKILGPLKRTTIENEIETNNINNDDVDLSLDSSQTGSNEIKASTQKPDKKSGNEFDKYKSKNVVISYISSSETTYNVVFGFFMCILILGLTVGGEFWLSFWYYHINFIIT